MIYNSRYILGIIVLRETVSQEVHNMKHDKLLNYPPIIKDFLTYFETIKGRSEKSVEEYASDLTLFFRYIKQIRGIASPDIDFDDISIEDVDPQLISSITISDLYSFLVFCKNERNNNSATRARKTTTLRVFFKYLTTQIHLLNINPAEQLDTPKQKKALPKYLSLNESITLLNSVDGAFAERDFCIITLFLNCGMRLSELCGLNLSSIDLDNKSIRILGKGNKERIVYLNSACESSIKNYLLVRPVEGVKKQDKDALFLSKRKQRISNKTVQYIVNSTLQKAGLGGKGYSTHKLRHTAATLMYQEGNVDVRVLKEVLGHENLGTTQIYTHVANKQVEEAINSNPLANFDKTKKGTSY